MFAGSSYRHRISLLALQAVHHASLSRSGSTIQETTVDHALICGFGYRRTLDASRSFLCLAHPCRHVPSHSPTLDQAIRSRLLGSALRPHHMVLRRRPCRRVVIHVFRYRHRDGSGGQPPWRDFRERSRKKERWRRRPHRRTQSNLVRR
jgi:hypothetical protein